MKAPPTVGYNRFLTIMRVRLSEEFIESLPTPDAARTFLERLFTEHAELAPLMKAHPTLLAYTLVLATHSPYLGEVMLAHPDYLRGLAAEDVERPKSKEELSEDLARFAAMHSHLEPSRILFRFKQREFLRIALRDFLHLATLAETMRELSDLADVILQRALWWCWQDLVDRYGRPEVADARGRLRDAEFAVVALGKLGSQELNYASDIDIFYLYSGEGQTSERGVTNKEFFTKLAARLTRIVGGVGPEGAVYRIDLRLRPRGRDGDLVVTLSEAVAYYRTQARNWERQTLLRARAAAGSNALVSEFLAGVGDVIYPPEPLEEILDDIRASTERFDQDRPSRSNGLDIKWGRGGIREIEFIVQALQLYHGGRDPWVRHPQILIGMQRLADKGWLSDRERAQLSEAYIFFRTLEHRLQMEQGVRTHALPTDEERLQRLARRMGYAGSAHEALLRDVERHRCSVMAIFERVFHESASRPRAPEGAQTVRPIASPDALVESLTHLVARHGLSPVELRAPLREGLARALHPHRAAAHMSTWIAAASSWLSSRPPQERDEALRALPEILPLLLPLLGTSEFLTRLLLPHPQRAWLMPHALETLQRSDRSEYARRLRAKLDEAGDDPTRALNALRRAWADELLCIGTADLATQLPLQHINALQTALASAALEVAFEWARRMLQAKYGASSHPPVFAVLGLGRLGHNGMDYGSDLDIIVVYDERAPSPLPALSPQEAYGRLTEEVIRLLSTITHEGSLYRVDLRLRPGGNASPLAQSAGAFGDYLRTRAATWERLAYLKAFPVAGDPSFGRHLHEELQELILRPRPSDALGLAHEVRQMRERIEREKARPDPHRNFKFGPGGMMDVYFATRYLQVKHQIPEPEQRGTLPLLAFLHERGVLSSTHYVWLAEGYGFLRRLDHALRLFHGRSPTSLPTARSLLEDLATWLGLASAERLERDHQEHRHRIRSAYDAIVR